MTSFELELELQSPLLVGGRRSREDDTPSADVISGGVMRAAFAAAILRDCPYPGTDAHPPGWVAFRDGEACPCCRWQRWCRQFGELTIEALLPKGAQILPLTARACRQEPRVHGVRDTLRSILQALETGDAPNWDCPHCPDGAAATEQVRGLRDASLRWTEPYRLARARSLRTSFDPERQRAADGQLYGVSPILPDRSTAAPDGAPQWERQRFVGAVHARDPLEPLQGRAVPVGARTTTGFGDVEARLTAVPDSSDRGAVRRVQRLNAGLDAAIAPRVRRHVWLTLDLLTEAVIAGADLAATSPLEPAERLQTLLLSELGVPGDVRVDHAWLDWGTWRGWDTRHAQAQRKPAVLRVHAGSVLVMRAPRGVENSVLEWVGLRAAESLGVRLGRETADGFGRAQFVHPFHLAEEEGSA